MWVGKYIFCWATAILFSCLELTLLEDIFNIVKFNCKYHTFAAVYILLDVLQESHLLIKPSEYSKLTLRYRRQMLITKQYTGAWVGDFWKWFTVNRVYSNPHICMTPSPDAHPYCHVDMGWSHNVSWELFYIRKISIIACKTWYDYYII